MAIQEGAVGTPISATVRNINGTARDISDATTKNFIFRKPDGTQVTKAAEFLNDGTDGKLFYVTTANDMIPAGAWKMQSDLVQVSGYAGRSSVAVFFVNRNV